MNEKVSQSMSQPQGMSAAARRNRRIAVSTLCVAIVGLVGYYLWLAQETPAGPAIPPDPRLTFETPYRNVHPDVQYVDDSRCTQCHQEIADNYGKHPMANSLRPIGNGQPTERLSTEDGNPFQRDGYEYSIRRAAGELIQSEIRRDSQGKVVSKAEETMALAIGAGRHATSYLFERDGCYFYSPVTWYSRRGRWDISPAFVNTPHHFTETAGRLCLFCHGDRLDSPQPAESRHVILSHSIGCQRCHGPGELHVRRQDAGEKYTGQDFTIVNPSKLKPVLRESVCEQCHLEGISQVVRRGRDLFDYRPGLPLHLFRATYLPTGKTESNFVGHPEQMRESACYKGSKGTLSCISCHDPHILPSPEKRIEFFRARCMNCHEKQPCAEPQKKRLQLSPADDCTLCHMPQRESSDIGHVVVADHRIPRHWQRKDSSLIEHPPRPGEPHLRHFHAQQVDEDDPHVRRDLGIGLMRYAERVNSPDAVRQAISLLQESLARDPDDSQAWKSFGGALYATGSFEDALSAYDEAIRANSGDTYSMTNAALILIKLKRFDDAIKYLNRALKIEPQHPRTRRLLGDAALLGNQLKQAEEAYRTVLRHNPADTLARQGLGDALFKSQQVKKALTNYEINLKHDANFLPSLQGLGDCYVELKRWKEATTAYERVVKKQPNNIAVRKRLIECYRETSDTRREQQAREALRRLQGMR